MVTAREEESSFVLERRDKELQERDRQQRIENSKYNKCFKWIRAERVPRYFEKGWSDVRMKRLAIGSSGLE